MSDLVAWKEVPEHLEAQALGRTAFYLEYEVEVAEIVRRYQWKSSE
jgi:heme-degrading monooxygenase HmoA